MLAEVESEANDALVAQGIDHLIAVADGDDPVGGSIMEHLVSAPEDWSNFEPSTEPAEDIDPPTPDYQPSQDYREAAPAGVDADYANTLPGGDGSGVKIVDIEGAWKTTHEDLEKSVGGLLGGSMIDDLSWRNHGTAVIGEMIAGDNGYGVTGICPGAGTDPRFCAAVAPLSPSSNRPVRLNRDLFSLVLFPR